MTDAHLKERLIRNLLRLREDGDRLIIVHGGGPFIRDILDMAAIRSEFVDGQRKTSPEAMEYVEMALKGKVNGDLVRLINRSGYRAVGLSGKDGQLVVAKKRVHQHEVNGQMETLDLGRVGDVDVVQTELLELLLDHDFIPVIACLAADREGRDLNINGDVFAGHIAGAMNADEFIVLTDVDGLMKDIRDPESLITSLSVGEVPELVRRGIIRGGMIPKLEACSTALERGASSARIMNGTRPEKILSLGQEVQVGTRIVP